MTPEDDFTPVVDSGEIERPRGLLGRRRQPELPPVRHGFVRVVFDSDGRPLPGGERRSAGERRWSGALQWATVDMTEHVLPVTIAVPDPVGRVGLEARMPVRCRVIDAAAAAMSTATSVRGVVEASVGTAVRARAGTPPAGDASDPIAALSGACAAVQRRLDPLTGKSLEDLPEWLTAVVGRVDVSFDEATRRHHEGLVSRLRAGDVIVADGRNRQTAARNDMTLRDMWREHLTPHLVDPVTGIFESVFDDPSSENIAAAVAYLRGSEQEVRTLVLRAFNRMIDDDLIDRDDEIFQKMTEVIALSLGSTPFRGDGAALPAGMGAARPAPIEGTAVEAEAVEGATTEAEAVDGDVRAPGNDDQNWADTQSR